MLSSREIKDNSKWLRGNKKLNQEAECQQDQLGVQENADSLVWATETTAPTCTHSATVGICSSPMESSSRWRKRPQWIQGYGTPGSETVLVLIKKNSQQEKCSQQHTPSSAGSWRLQPHTVLFLGCGGIQRANPCPKLSSPDFIMSL